MRYAELRGLLETGEPCALKGASTVRGGAVGKGLAEIPPERFLTGQRINSTSLAAYSTGGKWCYLYRAIDSDGNLVDSRLSEKRDMDAAKQFFKEAVEVCGHVPDQVTTDGHISYPRAIRETMGESTRHRTNKYLNNVLEQDHRGVKQRYYPMHGFGSFDSAARFCRAFDELRYYFRLRSTKRENKPLVEQRRLFCQRFADLQALVRPIS